MEGVGGRRHGGRKTARVALIQLPIPDPDPEAAVANVPLAAGYLKAYAVSRGLAEASDILIAPSLLARFGGDAAVVEWVKASGADFVGFTAHMWSIQRSLTLARMIKDAIPSVKILMGGPEIVEGQPALAMEGVGGRRHGGRQPALSDPSVDSFAVGEGESAFAAALEDWRQGREPRRVSAFDPLPDLEQVPDPYLAGAMERQRDDPLYLETMRGCPNRCAYCYYGKSFPRVRRFPAQRLDQVLAWARRAGVPEIYVMDPAFDSTPLWEQTLASIASFNTSRIPLHTEVRLESITEDRAELLKAAGFRSVEVGLQSTTASALQAVDRSWDRDAFIRGAKLLKKAGIRVKTGIILGLPRDTPEGFRDTVRFLSDLDLAADVEIHPLSVLPGTRLKERARELEIRYMGIPPYWTLSTPTMSEQEIIEAIGWVEDFLDIELFPPIVPRFRDAPGGYTGFLDLRSRGGVDGAIRSAEKLSNTVTLLIDGRQLGEISRLENLGARLLEKAPHSMARIVVACEDPLDVELMERLAEAFYSPGHYFNTANYFNMDPQGRFSTRLYRLAGRVETIERARPRPGKAGGGRRHVRGGGAASDRSVHEQGEPWETIIRATPELFTRGRHLLEDRPLLLIDGELPSALERKLAESYRGFEGLVIRPARPIPPEREDSKAPRATPT